MKKNNFRKGILIVLALVLVSAISVGATLAYLTASTDTATNTFTAGEGISIEIQEPEYEKITNYEFTPGTTFDKDPSVKNTSAESPVYVVVSLEYKIDETSVPYSTFTNTDNVKHAIIKNSSNVAGFNTAWTQLTDTDEKKDYFVYGTSKSALTSLAKSADSVNVFDKVTISEKDTGNTKYEIIVNAYAVNADSGISKEVFEELAGLTGNAISKNADSLAFN
jgi:predicted ribosomally synthesized peptide with SipW-like signal peptide